MAEVTLRKVTKRYPGGVEAVKGIDLDIRDGEFVVLVGPSGCGKSTTLRMIAGLEDVTSGDLEIGGRRVNDVAPRDRDIAMVFQSYALYPHMTVRQNMAFGLKLRKLPKADIAARVDEAARMLDLEELLERKPKALSGGQRQRVAMGRAIVRQPSVFLFDEPLSNLDAKLRVQMRVEIAALHRRLGTTMVYVTHDQVEAMTLADRIAVMSVGLVQQFGTPMEVYRAPRNRFVAGFIGSPAMNFVEGRLEPGDGTTRFEAPGLSCDLGALLAPSSVAAGPATLGVRPHHLTVAGSGADAAAGRGTITHLEHMGAESFAHVRVEGADVATPVVVRLAGEARVAVGEPLEFGVDARHAHVFDESGENLAAAVHLAALREGEEEAA